MAEERISVLQNTIETSETENKSEWGLKKKKKRMSKDRGITQKM